MPKRVKRKQECLTFYIVYIYTFINTTSLKINIQPQPKMAQNLEDGNKKERNEVHTFKAQLHHGIVCMVLLGGQWTKICNISGIRYRLYYMQAVE